MKINARRFFKNAAILTATSLLLRLAGMFFRVWMANRIGSEGMGLYQLIFSVYMLAATFAGSSICTAVTRLVSEADDGGSSKAVRRIMLRSVTVTLIAAAISGVTVFLLSDVIAVYWIKDARAAESLRILCFSLPFMGISSCIKGYFVAKRQVLTPSNAQLFEQLVRMGIIMLLVGKFCRRGLKYACAAVLIGDTVAEAASCGFSWVGYLMHRHKQGERIGGGSDMNGVVRKLLRIAVPLAAGRYLTTALRTVENLMVPDRLTKFNGNRSLSLSQYGDLKGMTLPLLLFPASFLTSLATLLVPELSGAAAEGDGGSISRSVAKSIGITLNASFIVAGLFALFGDDIGRAFYGQGDVGLYLRVLAPLVPLMYLEMIATGCLNGLDQQGRTLKYNLLDSSLRIALILIVLPVMGMRGFITVMVISNTLTSTLCLYRLMKVARVNFDTTGWLIRPAVMTTLSLGAAYGVHILMPSAGVILRSIAECSAGGGIYVFLQLGKVKQMAKRLKPERA